MITEEADPVVAKKPRSSKRSKENIPTKDNLESFVLNKLPEETKDILFSIDSTNVFDNFHRINVWTMKTGNDRVVPTFNIADSFFVEVDKNDKIVDLTRM